jgi:hypothetical protein
MIPELCARLSPRDWTVEGPGQIELSPGLWIDAGLISMLEGVGYLCVLGGCGGVGDGALHNVIRHSLPRGWLEAMAKVRWSDSSDRVVQLRSRLLLLDKAMWFG